ncbi:MAG: 4Fe-4S binding protein [Desulfosudis oleivorans]|nr:4Fe-4S binding protein [Desulfosudis oleivorans]
MVAMDKRTYHNNDQGFDWTVDLKKCIGSGECIQACPMTILVMEDDGKVDCVDIEKCISCCACVNACPKGAIKQTECG